MVEGRDYCVRVTDLPYRVHGVTATDESGYYNIYLNARRSEKDQREALDHELEHINRNDFDKTELPLEAVENI